MRQFAETGNKELQLPILDPYRFQRLSTADLGEFNNLPANFEIWDADMTGYKTANVLKAEFTRKKKSIKGEIIIQSDSLDFAGMYKISGMVLILPIDGTGAFNISMGKDILAVLYA